MTAITIRDVPKELRDKLAAHARTNGQSLQSYLLEQLDEIAESPHPNHWLPALRERVAARGATATREEIIADIDDGRR